MAIKFVEDSGTWTGLADFASELSYADWRDEVLSTLDTYGPGAFGPPVTDRSDPVLMTLRPAV